MDRDTHTGDVLEVFYLQNTVFATANPLRATSIRPAAAVHRCYMYGVRGGENAQDFWKHDMRRTERQGRSRRPRLDPRLVFRVDFFIFSDAPARESLLCAPMSTFMAVSRLFSRLKLTAECRGRDWYARANNKFACIEGKTQKALRRS